MSSSVLTGLFTAPHGVPGFEKLLGCALVERLVHVRPFDNLRCVTAAPVLLCLSTLIASLNPTQVVRITGSCPTIQEQERPKPPSAAFSCPVPEFLLLPYASVNSGTSRRRPWKDNPPTTERARTEGLAQTCRTISQCRTGHRGLKSMKKELGGSELPIGGVPHCVLDCGQGVCTQKHVNKLVSRMSERWMRCPSHSDDVIQQGSLDG